MIITMRETRRGTENGFTIRQYVEGETYDVSDSLGGEFVNAGFATSKRGELPDISTSEGKIAAAMAAMFDGLRALHSGQSVRRLQNACTALDEMTQESNQDPAKGASHA